MIEDWADGNAFPPVMSVKACMTTLEAYLAAIEMMRQALHCPHNDIRCCVSPNWHRKEWRYAGQQKFICSICERLNRAIQEVA